MDRNNNAAKALNMNVLQISPYEPPASGWTKRIKLLRRVIEERGGVCEILDIGPNRKAARPGCISVKDGRDYLMKLLSFSRKRYITHCHINAEYFRGLVLALAACFIARMFRNRCLVTFHGGIHQAFLFGWQRRVVGPFFRMIFSLAQFVICNSQAERQQLSSFKKGSQIFAIPAFSKQYLEYKKVKLDPPVELFLREHSPIVSVYLCFRKGFFTDTVVQGLAQLVKTWPRLGLVIVGTGNGLGAFIEQVSMAGLEPNVCIAGDLGHNAFMTLISRSDGHLRTHVADGVSATVLEALSLRIPVVASENGTRPPSVITYKGDDAEELARAIDWTLNNRDEVIALLKPPEVADTAEVEVDLILGST